LNNCAIQSLSTRTLHDLSKHDYAYHCSRNEPSRCRILCGCGNCVDNVLHARDCEDSTSRGMIAMFPLSIALRDFYYTQKLGRIIEDTLFGLMLASILSSTMLSVATYLLQNWNSSANMFRIAGIQPQWVAITAVLTSLVAVTILAPYTSATYQIVSETGMVAGGVASAMWLGDFTGGYLGCCG